MLYPDRYNDLNDIDLIKKYKETSDKVFVGILYKRYSKLVFGLCMKYLQDEEDAQDITINIFSKLFDDLLKHDITFFKSWLYTFSKNQCLMHIRTKKQQVEKIKNYEKDVKLDMEIGEEMHHNSNKREKMYSALEKAIDELNNEQKTCVILFFIENKSYQEISMETGYSVGNVKSYIQNGKRNLKIKLDDVDEG